MISIEIPFLPVWYTETCEIVCYMAADQRRRRLNSSTIVGCSFREHREQYRAKKKKLGFPQDDTNGRSNISLEWDDKNKSVVAKREQIGILQRDLAPFIDSVPHSYSSLADILSVPREIFELENLVDVLSYEVSILMVYVFISWIPSNSWLNYYIYCLAFVLGVADSYI